LKSIGRQRKYCQTEIRCDALELCQLTIEVFF